MAQVTAPCVVDLLWEGFSAFFMKSFCSAVILEQVACRKNRTPNRRHNTNKCIWYRNKGEHAHIKSTGSWGMKQCEVMLLVWRGLKKGNYFKWSQGRTRRDWPFLFVYTWCLESLSPVNFFSSIELDWLQQTCCVHFFDHGVLPTLVLNRLSGTLHRSKFYFSLSIYSWFSLSSCSNKKLPSLLMTNMYFIFY